LNEIIHHGVTVFFRDKPTFRPLRGFSSRVDRAEGVANTVDIETLNSADDMQLKTVSLTEYTSEKRKMQEGLYEQLMRGIIVSILESDAA